MDELIWLRIKYNGRKCECSIEPLGSIKGEEILDQVSEYKLLKEACPT
jgi:hypothetical protein